MTNQEELREKTKQFAIRVVRLFRSLPDSPDAQVIGKQLLRAGTSVGANYRAVCRARSHAEWLSRLGIVVEEADESVFWLELLSETGVFNTTKLEPLLDEACQLTAIFTAAQRTGKQRRS